MEWCLVAFVLILLLSLLLFPGSGIASSQGDYTTEKVFYGFGTNIDPETGGLRLVAFLNLTEGYSEARGTNGTYQVSSQIFVEYFIPADDKGPSNGAGLRIRFSYNVSARCLGINVSLCPLGANGSATSKDTFVLEIRRILEYRDADGDGAHTPGEPVVKAVALNRPLLPSVRLWPFTQDGYQLSLPFNSNISTGTSNITQGVLYAGDPLLGQVNDFLISVGNGVPVNLTLDSYMFLRPSTYRGIPLTPSQLKLDLYLAPMRYVANDTSVALEIGLLSSQYRLSANASASSERLYTSSTAAEAFFSWNSSARVDGRAARVGAKVIATNDSARTLYMSYPRWSIIAHDPVLGLTSAPGSPSPGTGGSGTPLGRELWMGVSIASGVVGGATVLYVLLRRRRGRG